MNNPHRINRIRIAIMDEKRKINRQPFTVANMKRHDLLQRRYEKCNLILFENIQLYNHE